MNDNEWWLFRYLGTELRGNCLTDKLVEFKHSGASVVYFVEPMDNMSGYDLNSNTNIYMAGYTCVDGTQLEAYYDKVDADNYKNYCGMCIEIYGVHLVHQFYWHLIATTTIYTMRLKDAILGNIYTLDWGNNNERWVFIPVINYYKMEVRDMVRFNSTYAQNPGDVLYDSEGFIATDNAYIDREIRPADELKRQWYAHRFQNSPMTNSRYYIFLIDPLTPIYVPFKFLP
jgi:hypothetical protein